MGAAALDLVEQRLAERGCRPRRKGDQLAARCPAHDDSSPSLSVSIGSRRELVLHCHAGCRPDNVLAALGLAWRDLGAGKQSQDTSSAVYVYTDEHGTPLYRVLREPGKRFLQQRLTTNGEWQWKLDGTRRVLYHLPEVVKAVAAGETVYVCEGEKDADRVRTEGVTATCNSGGAGKFLDAHADTLAGADVVVIADRDKAGYDHARQVRAMLERRGAAVRVVQAATGKDAFDHLAAGRTLNELVPVDLDRASHDAPDTASRSERIASEWTDSGVAERLAADLEGRYLYVAKWRTWMRWDGRRWAVDDGESVYEFARRWVAAQRVALIDAGDTDNDKRALPYSNRTRLDNAVRMAQRMAAVQAAPDQFDTRRDLLNVRNGVVDLRDGTLGDHDPALMISKLADVDYVAQAAHPDFDQMLDALPPEVRDYAQRWAGYCTTGETSEDVVMILDGAGANGKSTFLVAMQSALGEYAGPIDVRCVMKSEHEDHRTIYASLHGRRLATISELPEGGRLNVEKVKAISGGDTMVARRVYQDDFTWSPTHKLAFATNHRPVVGAADAGIWRRLKLLGFPYRYVEPDSARPGDRIRDNRLRARLEQPEQRTAMLAWLVAGAVEWYAHGLGTCSAVESATDEWQRSQDTLARFISERLHLDPTLAISGSQLYAEYTSWCEREGHYKKSNTKFADDFYGHRLIAGGVMRRRTAAGVEYVGVGFSTRSTAFSATSPGTPVQAGVGTSETFPIRSHGELSGMTTPAYIPDENELF